MFAPRCPWIYPNAAVSNMVPYDLCWLQVASKLPPFYLHIDKNWPRPFWVTQSLIGSSMIQDAFPETRIHIKAALNPLCSFILRWLTVIMNVYEMLVVVVMIIVLWGNLLAVDPFWIQYLMQLAGKPDIIVYWCNTGRTTRQLTRWANLTDSCTNSSSGTLMHILIF